MSDLKKRAESVIQMFQMCGDFLSKCGDAFLRTFDSGPREPKPAPNMREKSLDKKMGAEYDELCRMLDRVEEGTPRPGSIFEEKIRECFEVWRKLQRATEKEGQAKTLLSSFYGDGHLMHQLLNFCEYVKNELDGENDTAGIVISGFNSYLNFAWLDYKRMRDKLDGVSLKDVPLDTQRNIYDFFLDMSYFGGAFEGLYEALSFGRDRIARRLQVPYEDSELLDLLKRTKGSLKKPESFCIDKVKKELERKLERRREVIAEAEKLEQALDELMREKRILEMSNQSATSDDLKRVYHEMAEDVYSLFRSIEKVEETPEIPPTKDESRIGHGIFRA